MQEIKQYVKKPIPVSAVCYDGTNAEQVIEFCKPRTAFKAENSGSIIINTLEGDMELVPGAYCIRGVRGETYPCAKDIFEETYEEYI